MATSITIARVIARIESSGNPYAYRFEPTVYQNLSTGALLPAHAAIVQSIQKIHNCSLASAEVIYSSSYGLYQIMGFNLWGQLCCCDNFGIYLADTDYQDDIFYRLLASMGLSQSVDQLASDPQARLQFAKIYNGSPVYADAIVSALQYFNVPVIQ